MNNPVKPLFITPLTHILLVVTATTALTIFAANNQLMLALSSCYLLLAGYALYKNLTSWLVILLCMLMSSLLIITRINHQFSCYKSHQSFLKTCVTIEGVVEQIDHSTLIKNQTTLIINTTHIFNKRNALKTPKKISLFFPTDHVKNIQEYDTITVYNVQLEQPKNDSDYQRYLIKENIWAIAHCTKYTQYFITKNPAPLQQKALLLLYQQLHSASLSLFEPLFLGKKEKNIENLKIQHKSVYWGTAHHMARSGIHLAILFGLIMLLLHYTRFAHIYRYVLCIFLLIGYALISQSSISFLRALFMILLHIFTKVLKQIPSSLHTLTVTTLATLFYNPMQFFFLDFQLSFGITYIIIWLFNIKNSKTIAFYKHHLVRF